VKLKKLAYRVITAAGVAGVASCAVPYNPPPAAPAAPEQSTITVDSVPAADAGGLYIAAADGFFRQQGLNVRIKSITGGEAGIPDLQSGRAQLVSGNYVSFVLAQIAGRSNGKPADFRVVAPASAIQPGSNALYVLPGSPYKSAAALAQHHATVGLNTPRNVGQVLLGSLMSDSGYSIGNIRQVVAPGGFPGLVSMLRDGKVDAAWLPQPYATMAEQRYGATQIADFDEGALQSFPFTGYVGAEGWVRAHPRTVAAFNRALTRAQQVADTDRKSLETAMENYTGLKPIIADTMAYDTYPLSMASAQLQRVSDAMFEFGLTPGLKRPYQMTAMTGR
jgi:NitT/TauT family transport system substrate-binding protein